MISLSMFVVESKSIFQLKSEMHGINIRQNLNLYQPQANLTLYQKGVYYSGVKIFNNLPPPIYEIYSVISKDLNWNWINTFT